MGLAFGIFTFTGVGVNDSCTESISNDVRPGDGTLPRMDASVRRLFDGVLDAVRSADRALRIRPRTFGVAGVVAAAGLGAGIVAGGCGARTSTMPATAPHSQAQVEDSPGPATTHKKPAPTGGRPAHMTLYYLAAQKCPDPGQVGLPRCGGGSIATVSQHFKKSAALQGSAKLCDGRVVGVQKTNPLCFVVVPETFPWGITASGRPATPFRSIAVDPKIYAMGKWYYVPELDGLQLPSPSSGKVHDGCVRADDVGGAVKGDTIDLFVGEHAAVESLKVKLSEANVHLADGTAHCENAAPL